jgi:hypothetical protein
MEENKMDWDFFMNTALAAVITSPIIRCFHALLWDDTPPFQKSLAFSHSLSNYTKSIGGSSYFSSSIF